MQGTTSPSNLYSTVACWQGILLSLTHLSVGFSQSRGSSCSGWSELSVDKPLYGTEIHNPPCSPISLHGTGLFRPSPSLSVYSIASTFLPSPSPDSTDSTTRIGESLHGLIQTLLRFPLLYDKCITIWMREFTL